MTMVQFIDGPHPKARVALLASMHTQNCLSLPTIPSMIALNKRWSAQMTWATERLDLLKAGAAVLPPVVQTLQLGGLDDWGAGWVRKRWVPNPNLLNVDGSLFGGYLTALADQAAAFAAMTVVPDDMLFRTTSLTMNFVRVGRAEALLIEATVVAQTCQMITCRAELKRENDELIADASSQQLLLPMKA
jgi:uncharacterized protein (TIGR00369 family)